MRPLVCFMRVVDITYFTWLLVPLGEFYSTSVLLSSVHCNKKSPGANTKGKARQRYMCEGPV